MIGILVGKSIRVEIGSGDNPRPGYIGIDIREGKGDFCASAMCLPLGDESACEIYAAHVIEHIPLDDIHDMLCHWHTKLAPGGKLHIICPNLRWVCHEIDSSPYGPHYDFMVRHLYGMQDYAENFHYAGFTVEDMVLRLKEAGFRVTKVCDSYAIHVDVEAIKA